MGAKKHKLSEWEEKSRSKYLSPNFILENKDNLNFHDVCKFTKLNERIVLQLDSYMDWIALYLYQDIEDLSAEFFYNHEWYLDWDKISAIKNLPVNAIDKCPDKLDWNVVAKNTSFKEEYLEKYYNRIPKDLLCRYQKLSDTFLNNHWHDLKHYMYELCNGQKLSENFMREHKDELDWDILSYSQSLSEVFMDEMSDVLNWNWISAKQKMNSGFIEKHIDDISLIQLIRRKVYIPKSIKQLPIYDICLIYDRRLKDTVG